MVSPQTTHSVIWNTSWREEVGNSSSSTTALLLPSSFEDSHSILKHWQVFLFLSFFFFFDETYQVGDKALLTLTVSNSGLVVMSAQNEAIVDIAELTGIPYENAIKQFISVPLH